MDSDGEIARRARMLPVNAVGEKLGIPAEALIPYGHTKAKISAAYLKSLSAKPDGDLVLVTAMNPTPAGEGKTTTTVGLGDALTRIGKRAVIALREPSLGPCFGQKGGATGGGYSQVVPMDEINLHFTGDFHAITAAHNLLAAMVDNHIHWGNALGIDVRRVRWRRALDVNDRNLRARGDRAWRIGQWRAERGRVRHHGRIRSDGDPVPCGGSCRPQGAAGADHRGGDA